MRRGLAGVLLALAGLLAVPALAADHTISSPGATPLTYAQTDVSMDQGDTLTFHNDDQAVHDVTADANGPDGNPRFKSATIGRGKSAAVAGVEFLTTGDYGFHCTVHPFMKGTLHVSANGTPATAPPPDTTPPHASIAVADAKIAAVVKRKALRVTLTSNEQSRFVLTASIGKTTIAKGTAAGVEARRTTAIALTKAGRKLLARERTATVRLHAAVSDGAGNRSTANATRKLRQR